MHQLTKGMHILKKLLRSRIFTISSAFVVVAAVVATLSNPWVHAVPPTHVQVATATSTGASAATTIVKAFTSANTAGNIIVAAVSWDASSTGTATCSDTQANTYQMAATQWDSFNQQWLAVCYAPNIKAGNNTVTATLNSSRPYRRLIIHEYSGVATVNPVDVTAKSSGAGNTTVNGISSGSATTTVSGDLIFGAVMDDTSSTSITAGTGFTQRASVNNKDLATQDRIQAAAGSVASTQTFGLAHRYLAIMVALKPASQAPADTTPPSTPTGLNGTGTSVSQTALSWTASTDNVGVTGYKVFRNGTQVGTSAITSYTDTGLAPGTSYSYTVSAFDGAGNNSPVSAAVDVSTQADVAAPTVPANLAAAVQSSTQINVSWSASTDNVAVTGYHLYQSGTLLTTTNGTTTAFQHTGLTAGATYSYTVSAFDGTGNESAQSAAVNATTPAPDTTPPVVSTTSPLPGTTVSGTTTITANASDNVGVAGVQFMVDGTNLGAEDTTAPYAIAWDTTTIANGLHTVNARARDAAGNLGNPSSVVNVTVQNSATTPAGLVAGWAFGEGTGTTAADSSGNGNTATLVNSATWAPGQYGGGLLFGGNSYLTVPNSPSLDIAGTHLTLEMWVNPAGGSGDQVVMGKFWNTTMTSPYYQYGLEFQNNGTIPVFEIGTPTSTIRATMSTSLPVGQWSHLAVTFDGSMARFYLNGNLLNTPAMTTTITARGVDMRVGADISGFQFFKGTLDDVRIYNRTLDQAEVQSDKLTPLPSPSVDPSAPTVAVTAPANGSQVGGIVTITADAEDDVAVNRVQFLVDGVAIGPDDSTEPYAINWDTRTLANGAHAITARAWDTAGNTNVSSIINVTVANTSGFQKEDLAQGFDLPTTLEFLPDGRMLLGELKGKIKVLSPPYLTASPTLFNNITNIGTAGFEQGIYDITLDPDFATNHYYYVFYTAGSPNHDRLSRFTANAAINGTVAGSEVVLYEDTQTAAADHHGGSVAFANDGKILFTTGDNFDPASSQSLSSSRGKVLRINKDGTVPTDNPFYDGAGPNYDAIWARGLRNPFRTFYDVPTGKYYIGDVGGNDASTAYEEINLGTPGANYGWPNCEFGTCGNPSFTPAIYAYSHFNRDASITAGFIYHGTQFPSAYQGNFFFGDYAQNWIKRLTFNTDGSVAGVFGFEPLDGAPDGPTGDVVYLTEGPDGSLYYIDLGFSETTGDSHTSKIKRIRYVQSNQAPVALISATPTTGPPPLAVAFSSAGTMDPEGQPLTYSWDFGDGLTSTEVNPAHTYNQAGQYVVRLTVSDGTNSSFSTPLTISVGTAPTATINAPTDGLTFRAGDVIAFNGDATDPEDGTLPASAFTWNVDFLHEGHVHPGQVVTGAKNGTLVIPTSGHDFNGNTRYRITLTVIDANGLTNSTSVTVWPQKVNLSFDTVPGGLTLYLDGIAKTAPFTYDTLIGFTHNVEARDQNSNNTNYTFSSWSDGGAQTHNLIVPSTAQSYTATFNATPAPSGLMAAWGFNENTGTTAADASGNNNLATLLNSPTWIAGPTGHGSALSLDGTNDNLTVPNSSSLNIAGNALTISMWIKPADKTSDQVVVGKFWNTTMTSPYYQYGVELQDGGKTPVFEIGTPTSTIRANMGIQLSTTQWSHLTIVFNGTQTQFYVNGTLVATKPQAVSITARGNPMRFGADPVPSQFFKGTLDDVRIYNRALSAPEVTTDMNTSL